MFEKELRKADEQIADAPGSMPAPASTVAAHGADPHYKVGNELAVQERIGTYGIAQRFVAPMLRRHFSGRPPETVRVLDVGCGLGFAILGLRNLGYDAWGLEPGGRRDDADARALPYIYPFFSQDLLKRYPDIQKFDLVMSHGVIEHVGTADGNADLVPDYQQYRETFVHSQLELLKPKGILIVCGPNRLFPFDFQHGDHKYGVLGSLKRRIPILCHLTIPWHERNHLVSYGDLQNIALQSAQRLRFLDEGQSKYSSMSRLRNRRYLALTFDAYRKVVSVLPRRIRRLLETHTIFSCQLLT
jgi:SAM-dependent methyltransferase